MIECREAGDPVPPGCRRIAAVCYAMRSKLLATIHRLLVLMNARLLFVARKPWIQQDRLSLFFFTTLFITQSISPNVA